MKCHFLEEFLPERINMDATEMSVLAPKMPANHGLSKYRANAETTSMIRMDKKAKNMPHQFILVS